jgi:hypothetical protein
MGFQPMQARVENPCYVIAAAHFAAARLICWGRWIMFAPPISRNRKNATIATAADAPVNSGAGQRFFYYFAAEAIHSLQSSEP